MTDESQLSDTMKTFKEWMSSGSRSVPKRNLLPEKKNEFPLPNEIF